MPRDDKAIDRYKRFVSVQEIFPVHGVGIITRKDKLTIRWSEEEIWTTVLNFSRLDPELARSAYNLGEDTTNWKVARAQRDISSTGPRRRNVVPILYRPFDIRYTYYTGRSSGFHSRPCREVMRHMLAGENVSLITPKQHKDEFGAFIATSVGAHKTVAAHDINYYFPLYLYPDTGRDDLFSQHEPNERQPNLNAELVRTLAMAYGEEPSPEEVFHYVYAVLYAPSYREKYAEFLRIGFPRIPFTSDYALFKEMAGLGKRLVELHLLRSPVLDPPIARFQGEGDGKVETGKKGLRYDPGSEGVYINETQYFEGVSPEVWEYHIGGYQVCHKWLKDRKSRALSLDEIRTYCRIVTALARTIEIQQAIEKLYSAIEAKVSKIKVE